MFQTLAAYKIKFITVSSPEVAKSDFIIGLSVVNLTGNTVWLMDFCWPTNFLEIEIENKGPK